MVISSIDITVIRLFKVFPKGGDNRLCKVYDDKKKISLSRVSHLSVGIRSFLSTSKIIPLYNCYFTGPERLCSQNRVHHHPHCFCHGHQHSFITIIIIINILGTTTINIIINIVTIIVIIIIIIIIIFNIIFNIITKSKACIYLHLCLFTLYS